MTKAGAISKALGDTKLLKNFLLALIVRSLGAISIFCMNYLVARSLSPADAGYFFWSLSAIIIATQLSIMGLHDVALKFIAQKKADGDWHKLNYIVKKILLWTFLSTTATSLLIACFPEKIAYFFFGSQSEITTTLTAMAPGVVFIGLSNIISYSLQATQQPLKSIFSLTIGPYLFFCMALIMWNIKSPTSTASFFSASCAMNLAISFYWWRKTPPHHKTSNSDTKALWAMALPMWAIATLSVSVMWGGQFLSAIWAPSEDIARYSVALRAAALINFVLIASNFIVAPKIAQLHSAAKKAELQTLITNTVRALYIFVTPPVLIVLFFSEQLMALFGSEFRTGGTLLTILALGQLVNTLTGPVGYLLTMTGNERSMRNMYIISGTACILLTVILTPRLGIIGTAWATSISIALQNIGAAYIANKKLKISIAPILTKKQIQK